MRCSDSDANNIFWISSYKKLDVKELSTLFLHNRVHGQKKNT